MADIKISELTAVSALNNGDLVEVSQVNALAPSGYTSLKASMTDLGEKVNNDIQYTTGLVDFTDKTVIGAINENKAAIDELVDGLDDTNDNIGDLTSLTTTDKSSLVGAVNEVNGKLAVETDTYNITTYGGYVKCLKYGNIVTIMCVNFGITKAPAPGSAYTLANIASKYRPSVNLRVDGYVHYASYKYDGVQCYAVNSDGSIVTYNYGTPAITKGNFIVTFVKE